MALPTVNRNLSDDEQERALETKHSTGREAGHVAREAQVRRLVLTLVSSRYDVDPSNTFAALDTLTRAPHGGRLAASRLEKAGCSSLNRRFPDLGVAIALLVTVGAARAWADDSLAIGARLAVGGGAAIWPGEERGGVFELAPRAEAWFGDDLYLGPALEFRTANFQTAELAGGLSGAWLSDDGETGLLANLGGGYAWRRGSLDGAVVTATLGWGLLHVDWGWAASTSLYVSFRHALTGPNRDELTAGISFGGGFLDLLKRFAGGG